MPLDIKESNAGEIYHEMAPDSEDQQSKRLKYLKKGLKEEIQKQEHLVEGQSEEEELDEEQPGGFKILVIRNKKNENTKNFEFEVNDENGRKHRINRDLTDMNWLRNHLRKDFPYSYVSRLANREVPPVESVDFRETFVQNHFHRLAKIPHLRTSGTLRFFVQDDTFKSIKSMKCIQ